ncbi:trypsin-like peptidase domain-containing protein [Streptomyces sp. NPDC004629]|uniref:trypsin-like peptidase domain-containing protein n=1 Tax=Streptomyces sp. NPDC004629 TaxID=3364705 RepID=UPI0036C642C1
MDEGKPVLPGEAVEDAPTPVAASEGDFELARPATAADADAGPASRHLTATAAESAGAAGAGSGSGAADAGGEGACADIGAGAVGAGAAGAGESGGRDKPLHDPDPYSTPPYGEPGPWAPAPPVQHPATTPAHGTTPPSPPPAHDGAIAAAVPLPAHGAAIPGSLSADGMPVPASPPAHGGAIAAAAPPPAHGARVSGSLSADGMPVPASPPAHGTAFPAPVTAPGVPHDVPAGADAPQPDPTLYPAPGAVPQPDPTFYPAPGKAPQPEPTLYPAPGTAPQPDSTLYRAPGAVPPLGPWQRYDPWAAPAPLQQNGAAVPTEGQRRRRARKALIGGALALALVSGGVGGIVGVHLERNGGVPDVHLPQAGKEPTGRPADSVAGIAARALPSVVTLHVTGSSEQGTGTGFVLDTRGHILTNNHVVEPAGASGDITVTFSGGQTAKAQVVGRDSGYDLAVVRVKGVHGLKPLPLGNSDNVQVGDPVVAIGAPFDLSNTVTSGIISAKERPITAGGESGDGSDVSYVDALQTDAPINPGNSGGPLLDAQARVVGINSAIRSAESGSDTQGGQSGSIGLGFAIPVNQARRVAEELINDGRATHPVIGITLDMAYTGDGARIGTKGGDGGPAVTTGGPGDRAGLRPGDIITEIDGQRVHSGDELIVKTRAQRPGDLLDLTVERDGEEKHVSLVLGSSGHN